MNEQPDIAEDLGVLLPPPPIIEGVLHQGCKMVLSRANKSNKSWCLLDLATGQRTGRSTGCVNLNWLSVVVTPQLGCIRRIPQK